MTTSGFLAQFTEQKTILLSNAANQMVDKASQEAVSDVDFADAIKIASDPVCNLDAPFILADLLQSTTHEKATQEVERWTFFKGDASLAPPSQDFRKHVLKRLAVALNNSLCD